MALQFMKSRLTPVTWVFITI